METINTSSCNIKASVCSLDNAEKYLRVYLERNGLEVDLLDVYYDEQEKEISIRIVNPARQMSLTKTCNLTKNMQWMEFDKIDMLFDRLSTEVEENRAQGKYKEMFDLENHLPFDEIDYDDIMLGEEYEHVLEEYYGLQPSD